MDMKIKLADKTYLYIEQTEDGSFEVGDEVTTLHTSETLNGAVLWAEQYGRTIDCLYFSVGY